MDIKRPRLIQALPWALALVGLAIPMVGGGFIGWPFVALWLLVLLAIRLARPLRDADRMTRRFSGVAALITLALLGTLGGLYLMPAVIAWMVLGADRGDHTAHHTDASDEAQRDPSGDIRGH